MIINQLHNLINFLKKLGEGSFGFIWKVNHIETGRLYACKLVKNSMKKEKTLLQRLIKILHLLQGKKGNKQSKIGFTQIITSGQDHKNTYFRMNLLGDNLEQVRTKFGNFNTATILNTGQQMILLLKELHNAHIIAQRYQVIKSEKFVVHQEKLHLIDFGLSISEGKHLEFQENKVMIGKARCASIYALKGYEQSRRDELESVVIYQFIYSMELYHGTILKIQRMKDIFKPETCINLPLELLKYIKYVKQLEFDQNPDYEYLENLLKKGEDFTRSPKLQIQQNQSQVNPNLLNLWVLRRNRQQDNTSRRIKLEDLSSTGADIMEELDKDEGIQLQNLSVDIKQPKILNKTRTEQGQIFGFEAKLKTNQLPISLQQSLRYLQQFL
ncbi:unnamed protein product (macronuclear) [Paramecium tetraurelia]|uniref:Casein kinase I n=1 Tax=Paramecium tetraurelia TaxID=5888 RepID=A0BVN9_PARTE|nr:uncharacterized protein GSPATT00032458001 [Paramecium tetraurelia]CAK62606.1 unnamed protein product [Paramecium tetraurelia]|eukprot:XP_001430004.1 hypothetical protein (macronuclear) [Paramecium tetraurelia strain d4-2]